ncbi:hypothetical protein CI41S_38770 [Bradyrhizobium ivorense]|nr:hypothetical protein CI41S_38770 [Bradyrhizobium ivorense]
MQVLNRMVASMLMTITDGILTTAARPVKARVVIRRG